MDERAARVLPEHQVQERTPAPALAQPEPARAPDPVRIPPAKVDHRRIARSYRESLARLYHNPQQAHARFRGALVRDGRAAAVSALRETPQAFGIVRGSADTAAERARAAAQEAYRWSGRLEATHRLDLHRAAAAFREHEAIRTFTGAQKAVEDARGTLAFRQINRDHVRADARHVVRHAASAYQQPRKALYEIARSVRRIGADRTADLVYAQPERFGALQTVARKRYLGLATEYDTTAAHEAARALSGRLRGIDFNRSRAATAGDVLRARGALEAAEKRLAMLPARAGTAYSHATEMHRALERAGKVVNALEHAGVNVASRLMPMLPAQAAGLIRQAAGIARELGMGRDPERDRGRDRGLSL